MTHEPLVGLSSAWPRKKPWYVTWDAWDRYAWPRLLGLLASSPAPGTELRIDKFDGTINPGWKGLRDLCQNANVPLVVVIHHELAEVRAGHFNEQGQALLRHLRELGVRTVEEPVLSESSYRDNIHLNDQGQRDLAKLLGSIERTLPP
jgi:hypothetical protein